MKKLMWLALPIIVLIIPGIGFAQDFDGIWQISGLLAFISVHARVDTLVGVTFIPGNGEGYIIGNFAGNTAQINFSSQLAEFSATAALISPTSGTLTVQSCIPFPGFRCTFPIGVPMGMTKIF